MVLIRIQSREVNVNAQMLSHCTGLQTRHSSSRVKLFTTPHHHAKTVLPSLEPRPFLYQLPAGVC